MWRRSRHVRTALPADAHPNAPPVAALPTLARHAAGGWPKLPVVLTSGYSHVLAEDGRHGFPLLHKPYSAEDLARVLQAEILAVKRKASQQADNIKQ
jgi:hypothetical protein